MHQIYIDIRADICIVRKWTGNYSVGFDLVAFKNWCAGSYILQIHLLITTCCSDSVRGVGLSVKTCLDRN